MLYRSIARRGLMASAFLLVLSVSLLLMCVTVNAAKPADGTVASTAAQTQRDAAYKAAHDTDPHLPLTAEQERMLQVKDQQLADSFASSLSVPLAVPGAAGVGVQAAAAAAPTEWGVAFNQQPQQRSYWCGPATLSEALGQCGVNVTQAQCAAWSGTTTAGTAWSGGPTRTGYPMADVMNDRQSRNYYVPQALSYAPTSTEIARYKSRLVNNIYKEWVPLIGDAWQVPGGYHLVGHPKAKQIFHWFDIFGYDTSGAWTRYEDSVHGSSSIAWSSSVPAWSRQRSTEIATICGGRGYIW